jgi:hypothetical protein
MGSRHFPSIPNNTPNNLHGHPLLALECRTVLGFEISSRLLWSPIDGESFKNFRGCKILQD